MTKQPQGHDAALSAQATVKNRCGEKCALCHRDGVGLPQKVNGKYAHLNRDPTDHRAANLVYLCPTHYDEFQSADDQQSGLSRTEMTLAKERLEEYQWLAERDRRVLATIRTVEKVHHLSKRKVKKRLSNLSRSCELQGKISPRSWTVGTHDIVVEIDSADLAVLLHADDTDGLQGIEGIFPRIKGNASFFVGIIGDESMVDDGSCELNKTKDRVRQLFRYLRYGPKHVSGEKERAVVEDLLGYLLPENPDSNLHGIYEAGLKEWRGLGPDTPIVVLTNLAPGMESIVARIVQEPEFACTGFRLQVIMPCDVPLYLDCPTFNSPQPQEDDRKKKREFLEIVEGMIRQNPNVRPECPSVRPDLSTVDLVGQLSPEGRVSNSKWKKLAIPASDLFGAVLQSDLKKPNRKHPPTEKIRVDLAKTLRGGDRAPFDRRRRASTEALAVASHLMIALWDGQRKQDDRVSEAVDARLRGPQPDILPSSSYLQMPHGGPLWHVTTSPSPPCAGCLPPSRCMTMKRAFSVPESELPKMRILHPYLMPLGDCEQSEVVAPEQAADAMLQSERLQTFARIGANLEKFNREFHRWRSKSEDGDGVHLNELQRECTDEVRQLRSLIDVKEGADKLASRMQKANNLALATLFLLTLLGVTSLHASHADWGDNKTLESMFGWIAMLVFAAAAFVFAWQRARRIEQRCHDARAIAEGLRVQLYWNLAGLGESVSANYMTRHRSELDWVAAVIRSTSIPYTQWRFKFNNLDRADQINSLKRIRRSWVLDQLNYFTKSCTNHHHVMCVWHDVGGVAALAGVTIFLMHVLSGDSVNAGERHVPLSDWNYLILGAVCLAGLVSFLFAVARLRNNNALKPTPTIDVHTDLWDGLLDSLISLTSQPLHFVRAVIRNERASIKENPAAYLKQWGVRLFWTPLEVIDALVPTLRTPPAQSTNMGLRLGRGVLSFAYYLPLAVGIASTAFLISNWLVGEYEENLPKQPELVIAGFLLLAGTLSIAWAKNNFFSELSYQYNTMATLFHSADVRIAQAIQKLEEHHRAGEKEEEEYEQELRRLQAMLFRLGREALEENAEWLLLHRARPLEPLMPG